MEDSCESEEPMQSERQETISPKVARPKLPKFGSNTLGHHFRHKTDPGQANEIKNLIEEVKKWKEGSVFDRSPIRTKVIKPQSIKAHSTQTSPRASPPPGSPNPNRASSLNRNRSRSLKLLTDKLKSGRGSGGSAVSSPGLQVPQLGSSPEKPAESITAESLGQPPQFPHQFNPPSQESLHSERGVSDIETDKPVIVEPIPEKDEKDLEEDRDFKAAEDNICIGEKPLQNTVKEGGKEDSEGDSSEPPIAQIGPFTIHPIDRNSEFLRLRQMAPPKRRPGYAGLTLPKTKIPALFKSASDDSKDSSDENGSVKKPNRLELSTSGMASARKLSAPRFPPSHSKPTFRDDACPSPNEWYRSPSTETPPSGFGEADDKPANASTPTGSSADSPADSTKGIDDIRVMFMQEDSAGEGSESDAGRKEKKNGKSPKQKSKSDPGGKKTWDFDVINSSQSHSFPSVLGKDGKDGAMPELRAVDVSDEQLNTMQADSQTESAQAMTDVPTAPATTDLDVVNNNDMASDVNDEQFRDAVSSFSDTERSAPPSISNTDEVGGELSTEMTDSFEDQMCHSQETEVFHNAESELRTESPTEIEEAIGSLGTSLVSFGSGFVCESSPATPVSHSPTGMLDRQQNLLSVPLAMPKRPILRSVSSASVLQRERKFSSGSQKESAKDHSGRKHSLTNNAEDLSVPSTHKTMDFIPIGDSGNTLASSMPSVWNTDRQPSISPERETGYIKDKRYHIVEELYRNESEYVDALKMLKERYMDRLKTVSGIDEQVIDNIFYMIPEILMHHRIYLSFLNQVWTNWNTDTSTVGDIIQKTFSGQSVQESYLSFVENYKTSGRVIENALQTKSSVQKFVEQCQKESGSKLSMKDLIVRPIQRIPRYELLIQRLLVNTSGDHPDYPLLMEAEKVMHEFARKIGSLSESSVEDGQQETLKKLELLLITNLAVPDRSYLRHDMVQILNKKDQCCVWLFSDLIIISSVKRKSGPVTRKVSIIIKSPTGQDFAENVKHKVWLRVGLDDIEIVKSQGSLKRTSTLDKEQVEEDLDLLEMIQDLSNKLNCNHSGMDEVIKEMSGSLKKQLEEHVIRTSLLESNKMELLVTTQEGVLNLEVSFPSGEKRAQWEAMFLDAKQKLSLLSDKRAPEFLQPLQITKTRAGMQFSCASPIDGLNAKGYRDVWVCNSDGYVGHMCLLSLQPEPIVTLNTPVPGCNARILCIAAVPAHGCLRRKTSAKKGRKGRTTPSPTHEGPRISIEECDSVITEEDQSHSQHDVSEFPDTISEEGYQSDSDSSDETDDDFISTRKLFVEDFEVKRSPISPIAQSAPDSITFTGTWNQDPRKSTMWLGTEDGCIHIFQCTDNIKTTKNKLKIQLGYPVYCILYLDNKVFVSLSNGDLIVYRRDSDGMWDTENPYTRAIGSVTAPVVKMLAVAGKLWCGRQNTICVINPLTLSVEVTFQMPLEQTKCVQCIVNSGQGVWIGCQQSSKVLLYHATTYEFLMEVNIVQAVTQKLQAADDIIRQHKTACLRITALLVCKDLLWVGTSAGVILTIPMPRITSTTTRGSLTVPNVTGLVYGHTGHVRFLTCVELSNSNVPPLLQNSSGRSHSDMANNNNSNSKEHQDPPPPDMHRRSSVATMTATLATRMLVISGGDGYEDFRNNANNESAGKDDSTNHLLLWNV